MRGDLVAAGSAVEELIMSESTLEYVNGPRPFDCVASFGVFAFVQLLLHAPAVSALYLSARGDIYLRLQHLLFKPPRSAGESADSDLALHFCLGG